MHTTNTLTDLGPAMQRFLIRACIEGVALDDPLATQKIHMRYEHCSRARADVLEARGLIHKRQSKKGRMSWRCTDTGRGLVASHVPTFLHKRGFPSYTHKPWQAMHGEPEVVDVAA